MSRFFHGFLHVVAVAGQYVNIAAVPGKWQGLVAVLLALAQGGLAIKNQPPKQ